jgi:hypothetical protein
VFSSQDVRKDVMKAGYENDLLYPLKISLIMVLSYHQIIKLKSGHLICDCTEDDQRLTPPMTKPNKQLILKFSFESFAPVRDTFTSTYCKVVYNLHLGLENAAFLALTPLTVVLRIGGLGENDTKHPQD